MTEREVDLVVIGTGPGGEALATGAAKAGLDVVAVEKHLVGGECPYYGCIPTKMMVRGSDVVAEVRRAAAVAGEATISPAWSAVARRINEEATTGWDDSIAWDRLLDAGATVRHGVARLTGVGRVAVDVAGELQTFTARRGVVLNPGTRPAIPPIDGLADTPYWTNRDAVRATELPGSVVIVGGGAIGCELAQVFARFGVRVTVVQHGLRLLAADEPEASALVAEAFAAEGIRVLTGVEPRRASYADGSFTLDLDTGEQLSADKLLVAAGRTPNLDDLGLETVGLDPATRVLETDERLRVQERLWAIGDVTGKGAFTHVSMYQSAVALRDVLGEEGAPARYHAVPHTTFTDPEVGGVGMTEQQARDAGLSVRTGLTRLEQSSRGFTHGPGGHGVIKVVEDADRGVLVGATAMGPAGGEILGFLAVAVHAEVPVDTLRTMIYAYPTFHRAIESALADLS
ncbi:NAD(P)/FAD-dependent oxidoreductase [Nocardioides sp. YIM 152315]|uniref:dihydrolipoyl dehydrogenase family protein n=1 Tax=Nocardioides sp. YIM 152315 TaxID=3031760 RepID=UPI0023DACC18|nr:NAD(P)/FAD-dependent oxidoreductase [Nocardioides sp. YIM 152315]MDF1605613.1 NAD(P)/FAD-dependent oxidoreductase [Nocardioides sp. YIM 152315]